MARAGLMLGVMAALAAGYEDREKGTPLVVGLTSSFFVGGGDSPGYECSVGTHRPPLEIGHTFGAGGGGQVWQHSGLVITFDSDSMQRASKAQSVLRLEIETKPAPFRLQDSTMFIGVLNAMVEVPMHQEVHGRQACPPRHCLIPQPEVVAPSQPHCGWQPPLEALSMLGHLRSGEVSTLEVDMRPLLAKNASSFKVWAAPTSVSDIGMWQTPRYLLRSIELAETAKDTFV